MKKQFTILLFMATIMALFTSADITSNQDSYFAFENNYTNLWTPAKTCSPDVGVSYTTSFDGSQALVGNATSFLRCDYDILGFDACQNPCAGIKYDFTISMVVKLVEMNPVYNIKSYLFGQTTASGKPNFNIGIDTRITSPGYDFQKGGEGSVYTKEPYPVDSEWYNVVWTYDASTDTEKAYINGVLKDIKNFDFNSLVENHDDGVGLGQALSGSSTSPWRSPKIELDEYRSWGRTLSDGGVSINQTAQGDIAELYAVYSSDIEPDTAHPPNIILYAPSDGDTDNTDLPIQFKVTDSVDSNFSCELYIDSLTNLTNTSVLNDTMTYFYPDWSEGTHDWYIVCDDGSSNLTSSSVFTFTLDLTEPFITMTKPLPDNTTVYSGYIMDVIGNITDNSLFRVNSTIFYPNGTVFYNNYTGNLTTNTSVYGFDWDFNTSELPNGVYTFFQEASDSHTAKYFPPALIVNKNQGERKLSYGFADNTIEVSLVGGNVLGQFENITTNKELDRYNFELNFKNTINPNSRMVFRVTSLSEIFIIENSEYPAHMVTGDYWLDFAGVPGTITTSRIDSNTVEVEIITSNGADKFIFESLGGLNQNNITISFEIDNCVPSWSCSGYTACNISDESTCNNVFDTNFCSLPYTGDYSEFSVQACNYCANDLSLISLGVCNNTIRQDLYGDNNFATCCNVTGLESDCAFGNDTQGYINVSCSGSFISAYATDDITKVTVDGIVIFLITISSIAGVIGIIVLYNYARVNLK